MTKHKVESKPSPIHGNGYFAIKEMLPCESFTKPLYHGFNSSCKPNVEIFTLKARNKKTGDYQQVYIANRTIKASEELTAGYNVYPCNCGQCNKPYAR